MPAEPKTWTRQEVIKLIKDEIEHCYRSNRRVDREPANMAETIYGILNDDGLIELTP